MTSFFLLAKQKKRKKKKSDRNMAKIKTKKGGNKQSLQKN